MESTQKDLSEITKAINQLPDKIFNTDIIVNNGHERSIKFLDAIKENWERIVKLENNISEGNIWISVKDAEGFVSKEKLTDILTKLNTGPTRWANKTASFGDNLSKIILLIIQLSAIGFAIYSFIKFIFIR